MAPLIGQRHRRTPLIGHGHKENEEEEAAVGLARGHLVVLDAFCGVAGNTIAFARCAGTHVIAYDNDAPRLLLAAHNAGVYGVRDVIDVVCDDVIVALKTAASNVGCGSSPGASFTGASPNPEARTPCHVP